MAQATSWDDKKILFVTGKGGVGKSLAAAALARQQAERGRKVLLAELGENSYYKDFWRLPDLGNEPRRVPGESFDVALWSGESCLREYVLHYLKVERVYKLFFENKVMRSLINVAPGLSEIAILGKITSGIRKVGPPLPYDVVIVDSFATGHSLAMLRAPKGMMEAIKFGPMGHHSREMQNAIQDEKQVSYFIVTLLEELPVVETLELRAALKSEFGVEPIVICNKVLEIPATVPELTDLASSAGGGLKEFSTYLVNIEKRQQKFFAQLKSVKAKLLGIPVIFSEKPDVLVRRATEALDENHTGRD